ncbi:MAG: hypothetical protein RMK45_06055 [Armatimonadota bacterium]|nr:hypothetical protein [Armatimonadota bacterium]
MYAVLAVGWLLVALLAFWLAYWAGDSPTLLRVGTALYALLLALSLAFVVLRRSRPPQGGKS